MKLGYFTYTLDQGGAEKILSLMTIHLMQNSSENECFLYDASRISYSHNSTLHNLETPLPPYKSLPTKIYYSLKLSLKLFIKLRESKCDYCISSLEGPNFINSIIPKSAVTILYIHSTKSASFSYRGIANVVAKKIIKYAYNHADAIVAVSKGVAQDLIDNFGINKIKIYTIYNPIDLNLINQLSKEALENELIELFKQPVIISVGRLSYPKAHWRLIRSFKIALREIAELQLVIIGDGPEETYLKKLTSELSIADKVHFLSFRKNPFKYMRKAKLFVLTSYYEGLSNVIIESLACGLPVISTDCKSGPREILSPDSDIYSTTSTIEYAKYGVLIPPFDASYKNARDPFENSELSLSNAIVTLMKNDSLLSKYKKISHERAKDFSIEIFKAQWESILLSSKNSEQPSI